MALQAEAKEAKSPVDTEVFWANTNLGPTPLMAGTNDYRVSTTMSYWVTPRRILLTRRYKPRQLEKQTKPGMKIN